MIYILILFVILFFILLYVFYNREKFISNEAYIKNIYNDDIYTDVITFRNGGGMLGIDRCLAVGQLQGKGVCTEYGQTGLAYFYPNKSPFTKADHQRMKGIEYNLEDIDRAFHYLVYPNM
jgi:hypothetical protein